MNNRWIVFYNSYLIRQYETHVNVKICIFVNVVKYIYKYIYKNTNQTIVEIVNKNKNDEIFRHLHERYIDFTQIV